METPKQIKKAIVKYFEFGVYLKYLAQLVIPRGFRLFQQRSCIKNL